MRILMITPYLPYPLYSGGQTRSFNLLKNLSKNHEITLFCFIRSDSEKKFIRNLLPFCKKVSVFKRRSAWSLSNILISGFTWYPFLVAIYLSKTIREKLSEELRTNKYDLIHAETFYVMPNIPKTKIPTLLVEQTIEYQVYQHFVNEFKKIILKPIMQLDVEKVKYWETYFWKKANQVVAVSEDDKAKMMKSIPDLSPEVVPNGVDLKSFEMKTQKEGQITNPTILYVGNFKWLQNKEAVEYLIKKIWPRIRNMYKNSKLWVVGTKTDTLKNLQTEGIYFDENVKNIQEAYTKADIMLAPIKGPGGTRLKVLEAMAAGCPVITTTVGIEGIEAENNKEVIIADSDKDFADKTFEVLNNYQLRKKLTTLGRELVLKKYNFNNISRQLEKIYEKVGNSKN